MENHDTAIASATHLLDALGLNSKLDPELARTPERFVDLLRNMFRDTNTQPPEMSTFEVPSDLSQPQIITVRNIDFASLCLHHLVPFFGKVDIAILPSDKCAGFGSFARVVDWASRKPQLQERLTDDIANLLFNQLQPNALVVRSRARQMCVELAEHRQRCDYDVISRRDNLPSNDPQRNEIFSLLLNKIDL